MTRYLTWVLVFMVFAPFSLGCEELPKAMGMQFGMPMYEVSAQLVRRDLRKFDEKGDMLAFYGSFVAVDRPASTYTYYKVIKSDDPTKWPEKKLCKIITYFDTTAVDNTATDLMSRYNTLRTVLIQKYGQPSYQREISDPTFNDPSIRLLGIQSGNSEYYSTWESGGLAIKLSLRGETYSGATNTMSNFAGKTKEQIMKEIKSKEDTVKYGKIVSLYPTNIRLSQFRKKRR